MIVIDPNFGKYLILVFDLLKLNLVKYWLMLKYHPKYTSSSLYKWLAMRKYIKIAEKIQKGAKK
jgi:hypothetical protein